MVILSLIKVIVKTVLDPNFTELKSINLDYVDYKFLTLVCIKISVMMLKTMQKVLEILSLFICFQTSKSAFSNISIILTWKMEIRLGFFFFESLFEYFNLVHFKVFVSKNIILLG